MHAATKPKPSDEEPEPPVSEPEPSKPGTPTRFADACLPLPASPLEMGLTSACQVAALCAMMWMTIGWSAMTAPYEAALMNFTPEQHW